MKKDVFKNLALTGDTEGQKNKRSLPKEFIQIYGITSTAQSYEGQKDVENHDQFIQFNIVDISIILKQQDKQIRQISSLTLIYVIMQGTK